MIIQLQKLDSEAIVPTQSHEGDAGYDLYSLENVLLAPGQRSLIKTGISAAIPKGYYGRVAPRSGLALKHGLDTMAGVVDCSYRGEIGVVLINLGQIRATLRKGERIAQLIIENCAPVEWQVVEELEYSTRQDGGYGSTGQ